MARGLIGMSSEQLMVYAELVGKDNELHIIEEKGGIEYVRKIRVEGVDTGKEIDTIVDVKEGCKIIYVDGTEEVINWYR